MELKSFLAVAAMALSLISCNKNEMPIKEKTQMGSLSIGIHADSPSTKAVTSFTDHVGNEAAITQLQLFIFDAESQNIELYRDLGTSMNIENLSTTVGKKTIWAVANYGSSLSGIKTIGELLAKTVTLEQTETSGFVMSGSTDFTVGAGNNSCTISISRLISRIVLQKVTNNLPVGLGSIQINNVFLSNVVANQNLGGTEAPATFLNKQGVADEETRNKTHIIGTGSYKASAEKFTFFKGTSGISIANNASFSEKSFFYTYPNNVNRMPAGFTSTFAPEKSVLVISATINSKVQYYPIVLSKAFDRNKTYSVELTITGPGTDDPNKPIEKNSANVTVTVANWVAGEAYEEIF